ncbi:MAG: nickel pincer cofactor biosynthesis protein LarB [Tissierellia bacterium]|nr:nickel pincer cofactor biosynthesis protein LarB [Tissierellia bacterium]
MEREILEGILNSYKKGNSSIDEALEALKELPYKDLGFAKVDNHRGIRNGTAEVIYGEGKTSREIIDIMKTMAHRNSNIIVTRVNHSAYEDIYKEFPDAKYCERAGLMTLKLHEVKQNPGYVAVVTGGTSDIPVAEEAALTLEILGNRVERIYDVGVAGIHRLLDKRKILVGANVIVAVAGMEGALASVVGGLVDSPVIAVPTSIGYGASFGGVAALLSMLNSCSSGVSVVNIDNGFGAGFIAARINRKLGG